MRAKTKARHAGIRVRHSRSCRDDGRCTCSPSYVPWVFSARDGGKIWGPPSKTLSEAKSWRHDALVAVRKRTLARPTKMTLNEAWDGFMAGARAGSVRNKSGLPFKPSALGTYDAAMTQHVLPDLGAHRLSDIARADLQALADRLSAGGLSGSRTRNVIVPLRTIFRRAIQRGEITVNPTTLL